MKTCKMKRPELLFDFYLNFWHKNRWCDDIILTNNVIIQTGKMQAFKYDEAETEGRRIVIEGRK